MTTNTERSGVHRRPPKFIRMVKARPRLFIAVAIGIVEIVLAFRLRAHQSRMSARVVQGGAR